VAKQTSVTSDASLFYLYFAHSTSLFKLTTTTAAAAWVSCVGGWVAGKWARGTVPTLASYLLNGGADREILIRVSPRIQRSAVHSNIQS